MRGKRLHGLECPAGVRNIPAYAGKTTNRSSVGGGVRRNIPAYAGKTDRKRNRVQAAGEHPRVCGENRPLRGCWGGGEGTSPRMRGKHFLIVDPCAGDGNIPAYAGKTLQLQPDQVILEEHPRVCGENSRRPAPCGTFIGTSPRMRGKRFTASGPGCGGGNIPAYAGKTFSSRVQQNHYQGTSPRMRGKLALFQKLVKRVRNIPAYAGKTCLTYRKTQLPPEHPRVCGENRAGSSIVLV